MSITALVDEDVVAKDPAFRIARLQPMVDHHVAELATKFHLDPAMAGALRADLVPLAAESPIEKTAASNVLDALTRYIPTEVVTLYVAALAAMPAIMKTFPTLTNIRMYWGFVVLTPVLFLIIYLGKRRSQKLPLWPASWKQLPCWKLVASTIAFAVWALAIPEAPYFQGDAGNVVAAFCALAVSSVLALFDPIFDPPT